MLRMVTALMALAAALPAQAQDWPTRPMTMIVPFAAGGAVGRAGPRARRTATAEILGQQIIIENVAGAGGMTGANRVAKAAPDGYTFVLGSVGTHAQNQTLYKTPAYDATEGLRAGGAGVRAAGCCWWRKRDLPANDLQEFIAYAKANDGKLQFGSAGVGSRGALARALFNAAAGINGDARSLPGRRAGDAGPGRRPHRLHLQHHHQRVA